MACTQTLEVQVPCCMADTCVFFAGVANVGCEGIHLKVKRFVASHGKLVQVFESSSKLCYPAVAAGRCCAQTGGEVGQDTIASAAAMGLAAWQQCHTQEWPGKSSEGTLLHYHSTSSKTTSLVASATAPATGHSNSMHVLQSAMRFCLSTSVLS